MKHSSKIVSWLGLIVSASLVLAACAPAATAVPTAAPQPTTAPTTAPATVAPTTAPATEAPTTAPTVEIKIAFFTSLHDPWAELRADHNAVLGELGRVTFLSKTDDVDALAERVMSLIR